MRFGLFAARVQFFHSLLGRDERQQNHVGLEIYGDGRSAELQKITVCTLSKLRFDQTDKVFTTTGEALHGYAPGWPDDGKLHITSLAEASPPYPRMIGKMVLLGANFELKWKRGSQGLEIDLPSLPPSKDAVAFKILPA